MQNDVSALSVDESTVFSLINIMQNANVVVQGVIVILFALSIYSWCVIIQSSVNMRAQRKKMESFNSVLQSSNCSIEMLENKLSNKDHSLANSMVAVAIKSMSSGGANVANVMRMEMERALFPQEKKLAGLANVSSLSPFIGLFGTIVGIMHSFSSIFTSQSVSLKVIAPSISEALLATAIGIFVAVPAGLFYNTLVNEIRRLRTEAEVLINGIVG